jgi:hypothetical protein
VPDSHARSQCDHRPEAGAGVRNAVRPASAEIVAGTSRAETRDDWSEGMPYAVPRRKVLPRRRGKQVAVTDREETAVSKQVSPVFALIVIVIAIALGLTWFMVRERAYQVQERQTKEVLRQSYEQTIRSGRAPRGPMGGGMPRGAAGRMSSRAGAPTAGGTQAPGEQSPALSDQSAETP